MMKTKTVEQTSIERTAKAIAGQIADYFKGLATTGIQKMSIAKMQRKRNEEGTNMGVAKAIKSSHCSESIDDKPFCLPVVMTVSLGLCRQGVCYRA